MRVLPRRRARPDDIISPTVTAPPRGWDRLDRYHWRCWYHRAPVQWAARVVLTASIAVGFVGSLLTTYVLAFLAVQLLMIAVSIFMMLRAGTASREKCACLYCLVTAPPHEPAERAAAVATLEAAAVRLGFCSRAGLEAARKPTAPRYLLVLHQPFTFGHLALRWSRYEHLIMLLHTLASPPLVVTAPLAELARAALAYENETLVRDGRADPDDLPRSYQVVGPVPRQVAELAIEFVDRLGPDDAVIAARASLAEPGDTPTSA